MLMEEIKMNMSTPYIEALNQYFLLLDNVRELKENTNNYEEREKLQQKMDQIIEEILVRLDIRERK